MGFLQFLLNRRHRRRGLRALKVDGIFGPATQRAVVRFQRALRIRVDGIVGPQTWSAIFKSVGVPMRVPRLPGTTRSRGRLELELESGKGFQEHWLDCMDETTFGFWSDLVRFLKRNSIKIVGGLLTAKLIAENPGVRALILRSQAALLRAGVLNARTLAILAEGTAAGSTALAFAAAAIAAALGGISAGCVVTATGRNVGFL